MLICRDESYSDKCPIPKYDRKKDSRNETKPEKGVNAVVASSKRTMTASGHDAGLQSATSFSKKEMELKKSRDAELLNANPELSGEVADTTYRDRRGKKLDMLSEFMRQQAVREGKVMSILTSAM